MLITLLLISCFVTMILILWLKTDVVVEYGRLVGMRRILKITEYELSKIEGKNLSYVEFLQVNYGNFFIRLITCKYCLGFWLSLVFSLIYLNIFVLPVVYILVLLLYNLCAGHGH